MFNYIILHNLLLEFFHKYKLHFLLNLWELVVEVTTISMFLIFGFLRVHHGVADISVAVKTCRRKKLAIFEPFYHFFPDFC